MLKNQIKTVLLIGLLTGILIGIGSFWGKTGLIIATVFAVLLNVGMFLFSHKIVLAMYRAKEITEKQEPKLHKMVAEVAQKAGVPKPKVYLVESENPNAFATGPSYKKGIIAYTTGIRNLLTDDELRGVTAHEMSHIKNRDMLVSTIAATIAGIISYLASMAQWAAIFGGGNDDDKGNIVGLLIIAILTPIIAMFIQLAISRSREYLADESGAKIIGTGEPLARALQKLEHGSRLHPIEHGNTAANNLFIVNPLSGKNFFTLLSTHPATEDRVAKLRAMKF